MDDIRQQLAEKYDRIIADTLRQLSGPLTKKKLTAALYAANKAYWVARLAMLDTDTVYDAERVAAALSVPYMSAMETFSKRVRSIYANYQSAFDLSQKDAHRLLNGVSYDRTIAQTLRSIADGMPEGPEKTEILATISAPAYKYRLDRAEQMCKQAARVCEDIRNGEIPTVREFLQTEVEKAYNISADEILKMPSQTIIDDLTGAERGISDSLSLIDTRTVNEIVNAEWSGENFSEAIWDNTAQLAENVKKVLIEGELTGAPEGKMAEKVAKTFETGMYEARRVVRTESNYCTTQAEKKALADAGFDEYEFLTVHEENVCDTCDDLDGKRFKLADAVIGVNMPPLHPFCRCRISSPEETEAEIQAEIDRMLEETPLEEIERRLDKMIEKL